MFDFVCNKYTYLPGREKCMKKSSFPFPRGVAYWRKKGAKSEKHENMSEENQNTICILTSSGITVERSLLVLCFLFKLCLRKNCFFW